MTLNRQYNVLQQEELHSHYFFDNPRTCMD